MYKIEIGSQLLQIYGYQLFQQIHNQVLQRFVASLFVKEFIAPGYRKASRGVSADRVFKIRRIYRFLEGGVIRQQQASAELVVTSNSYLLVQYAELEIGVIQAGGTNLCVLLYAKKAGLKPARLFMLLVLTRCYPARPPFVTTRGQRPIYQGFPWELPTLMRLLPRV